MSRNINLKFLNIPKCQLFVRKSLNFFQRLLETQIRKKLHSKTNEIWTKFDNFPK
jgi:hypothetical protein